MSISMNDISQDISAIRNEDGFFANFKNNNGTSMSVDGSATNVVFSLTDLPDGQNILLQSIGFIVAADEVLNLDKFGNLTALTNGIVFSCGGNQVIIKDNADIALISSRVATIAYGTGSNTYTAIIGRWDFTDTFGGNAPILTNVNDLKISIPDNLSTIPLFRVSCHGILIEG